MNREDRAKQFLPFDALKGLREELARRASLRTRVDRAVLSDSQQAEISSALASLKKGDTALITFYRQGTYVTDSFEIVSIDVSNRMLKTTDAVIYFDDLYAVSPENHDLNGSR